MKFPCHGFGAFGAACRHVSSKPKTTRTFGVVCSPSMRFGVRVNLSDPLNRRVSRNVEKYEKLLAAGPPATPVRPAAKHVKTRDAYERLCQAAGPQVSALLHAP